jgi:hypothetical protein
MPAAENLLLTDEDEWPDDRVEPIVMVGPSHHQFCADTKLA